MQKLPVEDLYPGIKLAYNVYDTSGRMLLRRGQVLTARHIEILRQWGIPYVHLDPGFVGDVPLDNPVPDFLRVQLAGQLRCFWDTARNKERLSHTASGAKQHIHQIITEISASPNPFSAFTIYICMMSTFSAMLSTPLSWPCSPE